jgi:hypothetical protein
MARPLGDDKGYRTCSLPHPQQLSQSTGPLASKRSGVNMGTQDKSEPWRVELARIANQLDDLKARSDEEYRVLHGILDAQIAELQASLRKLEDEVVSMRPEAYARRIAAQIEDLKAKGDAAYDRLQASVPGPSDQTPLSR